VPLANRVFAATLHFHRSAQSPIVQRTNRYKFDRFAAGATMLQIPTASVLGSCSARCDRNTCTHAEVLLSRPKAVHPSIHMCSIYSRGVSMQHFGRVIALISRHKSIIAIWSKNSELLLTPMLGDIECQTPEGISQTYTSVHRLEPLYRGKTSIDLELLDIWHKCPTTI